MLEHLAIYLFIRSARNVRPVSPPSLRHSAAVRVPEQDDRFRKRHSRGEWRPCDRGGV